MRALGLCLLFTPGCLLPFALPPSKADIGGGVIANQQEAVPALHLNAGISSNAAQNNNLAATDVQVGYVLHAPFSGETNEIVPGGNFHGIYGGFSRFFPVGPSGRTEVGGRGELLIDRADGVGFGLALHLGIELFTSGTGGFAESSTEGLVVGAYHGTGSLGLFLDLGRLQPPGELGATAISAGLSFRIPSMIGLAFVIPDF